MSAPKLDKQLILEALGRAIDSINAMPKRPLYSFLCGDGENPRDSEWFLMLTFRGTPEADLLASRIVASLASPGIDEQSMIRPDGIEFRECGDEPLPFFG